MLKKVLGTVASRIIIAVLTLVMVLVNADVLGPENVGTISLVILSITILQLVNSFVGGSALVYLVPRASLINLLVPAWLWAVFTAIAGTAFLNVFQLFPNDSVFYFHIIPEGYSLHVMFLAMILSLASTNFMILMGQERIGSYNKITVLQMICLFGALMVFFFVFNERNVAAYIKSLYFSYGFAFIAGFILILPSVKRKAREDRIPVLREIFRFGTIMQLGNIMQFLNYRVGYYFVEVFLNRAALGVYSVGVQLSESIWLVPKSLHMVQYTRISNRNNEEYAVRLTLNLLKITLVLTVICLALVLLLIHFLIPLILKPAYSMVPAIMYVLSPGIIVFSVSIILSPYFSGTGRPVHNTISAGIGLAFTLVFGFLLIPGMGLMGAAWTATAAYFFATAYQVVVFIRKTRVRAGDFLLRKKDVMLIISEFRAYFGKG